MAWADVVGWESLCGSLFVSSILHDAGIWRLGVLVVRRADGGLLLVFCWVYLCGGCRGFAPVCTLLVMWEIGSADRESLGIVRCLGVVFGVVRVCVGVWTPSFYMFV